MLKGTEAQAVFDHTAAARSGAIVRGSGPGCEPVRIRRALASEIDRPHDEQRKAG